MQQNKVEQKFEKLNRLDESMWYVFFFVSEKYGGQKISELWPTWSEDD